MERKTFAVETKTGIRNYTPSVKARYTIWKSMTGRCGNPNNPDYHLYGARGIEVCERWRNSFEYFMEDMGERPTNAYTLDRIDCNGNYEPTNCRWATKVQQANNHRANQRFEIDGENLTLAQWAVRFGYRPHMLYGRLFRGVPIERLFDPPHGKDGKGMHIQRKISYKRTYSQGDMIVIVNQFIKETGGTQSFEQWFNVERVVTIISNTKKIVDKQPLTTTKP